MIISLTGDLGSGKSTLAKMLAEKCNMKRYYMGQMRRDLAKAKGMTIAEFNAYGESHPETDYEVDNYQKELGEKEDNFVIEGRTSWFLVPQSIKIYISVDPSEGARRIFNELKDNNARNEGPQVDSIEQMIKLNEERMRSDHYRYKKYYDKDCFDLENFDFVLDTTNLTVDEAFDSLFEYIESL